MGLYLSTTNIVRIHMITLIYLYSTYTWYLINYIIHITSFIEFATVKIVVITANDHDITQLLLVMIIVTSKNYTTYVYRLMVNQISQLIGKTS